MKYFKRLNLYKASNLTLDITNRVAHSYDWYEIAKCINGQWYVNDYVYSNTTARHSVKIRRQLSSLGIEYKTMEAPRGLQNLDASIQLYKNMISNLQDAIAKKGTRKSTNERRQQEITKLTRTLTMVCNLTSEV